MTLKRACPICDGERARPAWQEDSYRYVRCSACGSVFTDVDAETYAVGQHNVWHEDELANDTVATYDTARQAVHAAFLRRHPPSGAGSLLDVGCGLGYFLQGAAAAGWDVYGCEPSPAWAGRAAATLGERIHHGYLEPGIFGERRFDLITVWDVLEHVFEPVPFLRSIAELLNDDGKVFIRTPNLDWVYPTYAVRRALGESVELGPLNHVVYFNARTLRLVLHRGGLTPIGWPIVPPPQITWANRDPAKAGLPTPMARVRNRYSALAAVVASASRGHVVLGTDLDVIATRAAV